MSGGRQAETSSAEGADQPDPHQVTATGTPWRRSAGFAEMEGAVADDRAGRHSLPASVIHELRTPLTSIHGYAQVLQRMLRDEPRAANATSVIARESVRLSEMLSLLSELAELEAGSVAAPSRVDVSTIVGGAADEVQRRDERAHPIHVTGAAEAFCNPAHLSQAMMHILTNAVRYSDEGQPVTVTIAQANGAVNVVVQDAGIGISPEDAAGVYRVYERGSNARQAGVRGLGLGLYLAQQALKQSGGNVSHAPVIPSGTAFCVTVPSA